jgi:hypothetical protein
MSSHDLPPLVTAPAKPLDWPAAETFVVPATFGVMAGHGRAKDAVTRGLLRPADVDASKMGPVERVFVPLWRVEGSMDGFHVGLTSYSRGSGRGGVMPTGGFRHHDGDVLVLARSLFPVDPSAKVKIDRADLVQLSEHPIDDAERVVPDVDRETAEEEARLRFRRRGEPGHALYAKVDVRIKQTTLVYYPLYVVRYRYAGEATEGVEGVYHAAISARNGELASAHHPPALRAIAGKLRRLFE